MCHECSTKNGDSSKKEVYHCDLCEKWFCEEHIKPKFPYFVDWDTVFNVEGDPRIKASFHVEYEREGGHPDFVFLRKTIEAWELEEKIRNQLIKQAIDRMMNPEKYVDLTVDSEADRKRRIEILKSEERELSKRRSEQEIASNEEAKSIGNHEIVTTENKYGCRFVVPIEVYSNSEYREYLNYAQTMKSVRVIVSEYYRKYQKSENLKDSAEKKRGWQ